MDMTLNEFLTDAEGVASWMFDIASQAFTIITGNWILLLSFCLSLIAIVVSILRKIKHIKN